DGSQGLMNEQGKKYRVNPLVIELWNLCDGSRGIDDLRIAVPKLPIPEVINKLRQMGLIEVEKIGK
ncbi:MAG: hypothetical protein QXJ75_03965, partial [Candidatus Bathyarchaeia archaeon]